MERKSTPPPFETEGLLSAELLASPNGEGLLKKLSRPNEFFINPGEVEEAGCPALASPIHPGKYIPSKWTHRAGEPGAGRASVEISVETGP